MRVILVYGLIGERGDGGAGRTRVVCKTLERRGKSLTPESRMEMLEERS